MRPAEWIQVGFSLILAVAAWIVPLPMRRRLIVTLLAASLLGAEALAISFSRFLTPIQASVVRDWLPSVLMLIPYWQAGQFFIAPNEKFQDSLLRLDSRWLPNIASTSGTPHTPLGVALEIAYLFCYPLVPLGLVALYAMGLRQFTDIFWLTVLTSTYICYAITPFFPALPPRSVAIAGHTTVESSTGRSFNRWLLKHGSIHAISFPSAHVASALAVALVLLWFAPLIGLFFLIIAICIGFAAVIGRYHYVLDVLLGALTAILVFIVIYLCHRSSIPVA